MRVLLVARSLSDGPGSGCDRVVTRLAETLRADAIDVAIAVSGGGWAERAEPGQARLTATGIPVYSVYGGEPSRTAGSSESQRSIAAFDAVLQRDRPDVAHFMSLDVLAPPIVEHLQTRGVAVLVDYHEDGLLDAIDGLGRAIARAEARTASSEAGARRIAEFSSTNDVEVVCAPIEVPGPQIPASGESLLERTGLRVASIDGVGADHGSVALLDALASADVGVSELLLAGPVAGRSIRSELREQAALTPGLSLRISAPLMRSELDVLLSGVDLVVVPPRPAEPETLSAHEAWSRGIPVVASPPSGVAEEVREGVNGFVVAHDRPQELADVLRTLAEDPELRRRLREGARQTPYATAAQYGAAMQAIYQRLAPGAEARSEPAPQNAALTPPDVSTPAADVMPNPPAGVPASTSHGTVFSEIYRLDFWRLGGESASGPGSRREATHRLRSELPGLVSRLGVRRMLDIGCGDFNWMRETDLDLDLYIGVDVVFDVVLANRLNHAHPRRRFLLRDLTRSPLPRAELVLCRDVLIHFPDEDLVRAMQAILATGARYLLTSTFLERDVNPPIALGDWRPVNLQLPPLSMPPPIDAIVETPPDPGFEDKRLGLWDLDAVRAGDAFGT